MGAQAGIAPADIDRCDAFSVLAMLGQHRHRDYWLPDHELAPDDEDVPEVPTVSMPKGTGSRPVASRRGGTPGQQARDASREMFARRRAAARGEVPPPEPEAPKGGALAVANLLTGGRVTGGD